MRKTAVAPVVISALLFFLMFRIQVAGVALANFMVPSEFDETPPTISIISPKSSHFSVDTIRLEFVVTKPATWNNTEWAQYKGVITEVCYVLDGVGTSVPVSDSFDSLAPLSFSVDVRGVSDGRHTLSVTAYGYNCYIYKIFQKEHRTDVTGHSETLEFSVEANTPKISILKPENKSYKTSDLELKFKVSEETRSLSYSLDSQPPVPVNGDTNLTGLAEGAHTIVVYATDAVGKSNSSEAVHFVIDKTAPKISVRSVQVSNKTDVKFDVSVSEPVSLIVYCLNKGDNKTLPENMTLTGLSDASHNVTFYAWDLAGNKGASETLTFSMTEPFPTATIVFASIVPVAIVGIGLVFYLKKRNH